MTTITQHVPDADLRSRVSKLTLEQKVRLLTGGGFYSMHAEPAIGLRRIAVSDGPNGVRGETWGESDPSACLPSATAMAASWDEDRIETLGRLLAAEARRKGVDVLLAPTINLHRTPLGGRHFECFSEDPLLTARIGAAFVRGVQDGGVAATIKHYVGNDSETDRMSVDVRIDERTLHEVYLAPFEMIVSAVGPWAVMAAYNGVNGSAMTESSLLTDPLKIRWGFDGVVMSDWFATRSNEPAARSALDLVMPGPKGPWGDDLVTAVQQGRVDEQDIDEKLFRLLVLARRVGALDGIPAISPPRFTDAQMAAQLRDASSAGSVLTRNDGVLPLDRAELSRVALLGPLAEMGRTVGGGAATVFPAYTVGPLAGLRATLGDAVTVTHAMGVRANRRIPIAQGPYLRREDGVPGMQVRFLGEGGRLLGTEDRTVATFWWPDALGPDTPDEPVRQVEVRTRLHATEAGDYTIGASGIGRYRVTAGATTVIDADIAWPPGMDVAVAVLQPPQRFGTVRLEAGDEVDIRLVHEVGSGLDFTTAFELNIERPYGTDDEEIEKAVALARAAEVAVVVVGTTEESEFEGIDRTTLALPGRQDELVRRVAEANPRTIVVVNAGAPVLLPWIDDVAAVLLVWFAGQEFGNALADMLLGVVEPGGRLPTTWPSTMDAVLPTQPVDGTLSYTEELRIGYRAHSAAGPRPLFAFGSGMGYTSWQLDSVSAPASAEPGQPIRVDVRVRNTGSRAGRQVVQAYVSRPDSAVSRPERWLAGFAGVHLEAGAEATVTVTVPGRAFAHWDVASDDWAVEAGGYEIRVGTSSALEDLCQAVAVTLVG